MGRRVGKERGITRELRDREYEHLLSPSFGGPL